MKKCNGCGALLQSNDINDIGYINNNGNLCERCFRIKHYGDYKKVSKNNLDFIEILKTIDKTNDLVILVIDIFNINKNINEITRYLNNDILLVFTKRDILPLKISDEKLLDYDLKINCVDKMIVSSNKNYNFDNLYEKINKYKKSNNVYIVGSTNAGKSTLINKLIYNYSDLENDITTSILPSTTLDTIEIKMNSDLTLIDTPGILDENNIINYVDIKLLKKILPKKEIKPTTYQVKTKQYINIEDILVICSNQNNLTLYFSNELKINRTFKEKENDLIEHSIRVKKYSDIVITGLGFIKVNKDEVIKIWTLPNVDIYVRKSLI